MATNSADAGCNFNPRLRRKLRTSEIGVEIKLSSPDKLNTCSSPKNSPWNVSTPTGSPSKRFFTYPGSCEKVQKVHNRSFCSPKKFLTPSPLRQPFDRFIPNRSTMDFESSSFKLTASTEDLLCSLDNNSHCNSSELSSVYKEGQRLKTKVLSFKQKENKEHNNEEEAFRAVSPRSYRKIPGTLERILDAPGVVDDFYLQALAWGKTDFLAVLLGDSVHLWNGSKREATELLAIPDSEDIQPTSVAWNKDGTHLALGLSSGELQLWHLKKMKMTRQLILQSDRLPVLCWFDRIVVSGCRNGKINLVDIRNKQYTVTEFDAHNKEVCGLAASTTNYIASGGDDNLVKIWDVRNYNEPVHVFNSHNAAVKAIEWCPWAPDILATGSGGDSSNIFIWNTNLGKKVVNVQSTSQVCDLKWAPNHQELVTAHGHPANEVSVWKYPSMTKVGKLSGHFLRPLCLAFNPDNTILASLAADETIRMWKCFEPNRRSHVRQSSPLLQTIR